MALAPTWDNPQEKKKNNKPLEEAGKGLGRLYRLKKKLSEKDKRTPIEKIQEYGRAEAERQKREKAEAEKKKKQTVEPSKGFIQRMMDKYWYKKKEK